MMHVYFDLFVLILYVPVNNSFSHVRIGLPGLKSRGFLASCLSTYDFSTLYTTLPHNLIKEKLTELIEHTFLHGYSLREAV